jgi:hypothetical protein
MSEMDYMVQFLYVWALKKKTFSIIDTDYNVYEQDFIEKISDLKRSDGMYWNFKGMVLKTDETNDFIKKYGM